MSAPTKEAIAKLKKRFSTAISNTGVSADKLMGISNGDTTPFVFTDSKGATCFKYRMSKYCRYTTLVSFLLLIALFFYFLISSSGSYLSAWYLSFATAVVLLFFISFPRRIRVTSSDLVINCILETTYIPLGDIKRIHETQRYRLKRTVCLAGSYGFGGFYGYWLDLIHLRMVRMYATKLSGLVIIQTIYNERYVVSCEEPSTLVRCVRDNIKELHGLSLFDFSEESEESEENDD